MSAAVHQIEAPGRDRLDRLIAREADRLAASSARSAALFRRASRVMVGGVASDHQRHEPWPLYMAAGSGATVTDVDGVDRIDFHNGFGAMVQGHAHPLITRAVAERAGSGTHLGVPTEDTVFVAEELARRWRLPLWRFAGTGTEAVIAAVRIARAATAREVVVSTAGAYHGHADLSPAVSVEYNDAAALADLLDELAGEGRAAACVLLEPAFLLGVVLPRPDYLTSVRAVTRSRGVPLIFDEVRTGLAVAAGGASERWDVVPDLVCLGKTLGGGLPAAAVGGTNELMSTLESGAAAQAGTYNGNALSMAAARTTLEDVLTADALVRLGRLGARMVDDCRRILDDQGMPGTAEAVGARGYVTLGAEPIADHASFAVHADDRISLLAWLIAANRRVYLTPARPQQWTLSVAHGEADADLYVQAFTAFVSAVREVVA